MNILKFLKAGKRFIPGNLTTLLFSRKESQSEEAFWYHVLQRSVGSTLSAKAFMYHKDLFCHLCLC